jgi:hypothetical protein
LVQQFYPPSLVAESDAEFKAGGPALCQDLAFVEADLNGTGTKDFIVAAYTNCLSAVVRVLQKQGSSAILANEPHLPYMGGIDSQVTLIDLDNDGRPEVAVQFSSGRGAWTDWIFKWKGTALQVIGPTTTEADGNLETLLGDAVFIDLNGDGILEIIDPPEFNSVPVGSDEPITYAVFTMKNRIYVSSGMTFNFFESYFRHQGAPVDSTDHFTVSKPDVPHVMTIVNGDGSGGRRTSSATITLNGRVVAGPNDFIQKVSTLTIPVTLSSRNTVTVRMGGDPGSRLIIGIGPK